MDKKCDTNFKYAYLCKLSYEKLIELLLAAPVPATTPEDEAYVDALEEAILAKENETPTGLIPDVDQQWLEFQNYYCNNGKIDELLPDQESFSIFPECKSAPVVRTKRYYLRRTLAIVAIIVLLVALTIPVALGYSNVFEMIGHWTDDYFRFVPTYEETVPADDSFSTSISQIAEYATPQDALNAYGVTQKILPTWFPEGFSLSELDIYALDAIKQNEFSFSYSNSNSFILISFIQHIDNSIDGSKYQKDACLVEEYQVSNNLYYLYTNAGQSCASWFVDNMECSINGDISMNELKEMIDSI